MIEIAILDDEFQAIEALTSLLRRFEIERKIKFGISSFQNEFEFLNAYQQSWQIIFLDIELRQKNGIDIALRIREIDEDVILIFVTNMRQYAIDGYRAQAYGYMVKPVRYPELSTLLARALRRVSQKKEQKSIILASRGSVRKIAADQILYVETRGHETVYHLQGEQITMWESLKAAEVRLADCHFVRCNSCYLVNLKYVTGITGYTLSLGEIELSISQPKKKQFMQALANYMEQ